MNPLYLTDLDFSIACELGCISEERFRFNAQRFVDGGFWRSLGDAWRREVQIWVDDGIVSL